METTVEFIKTILSGFAMKIGIALLILVVGLLVIKWLNKLVANSKLFRKMDKSAFSFMKSMISMLLKVLLLLIIAGAVGIPTASLIALVGSAGLAIGLAMQGSLSNLAGGLMILLFKPFSVGDYIISSAAEGGTVTDISIFYTTLLTPDNRSVVIPNGEISNKSLINYSKMPTRRLDMKFGVSYDSDVKQVKSIILEVASAHPLTHDNPEPFARLKEMADSALIFELRIWCDTADYFTCYFDINEQIKQAFDRAGISIPFPQIDVHNIVAKQQADA